MASISVVINTLNEEKNLPRALKSVKKFASEIVVVDMNSTDDTQKIAKKYGARVFIHERMGYVEPARNFAISKAKGEWIFLLDADEEVPNTLAKKLKRVANNPAQADYFAIARKNMIFGKWMKHSRWWPDYNIRFFKKGSVLWSEEIHSVPTTLGKGKDFEYEEKYAILHHHYENVEQYIERLNRYTTIQARQRVLDKQKFNWQTMLMRATQEFVSRYFAGRGYKDGVHGLVLALLQGFSELVVFTKIWQLENFNEEQIKLKEAATALKSTQSEINYWIADALVNEGAGVGARIKRKFKLS